MNMSDNCTLRTGTDSNNFSYPCNWLSISPPPLLQFRTDLESYVHPQSSTCQKSLIIVSTVSKWYFCCSLVETWKQTLKSPLSRFRLVVGWRRWSRCQ